MRIICEGPDGGGKTYWANRMQELYSHNTISSKDIPHTVPKTVEEMTYRIKLQEDFLLGVSYRNTILDRYSPISHMVYDRAVGRELVMPHNTFYDYIYGILSRPRTMILYFRPSNSDAVLKGLEAKPHKTKEWVDKVKDDWFKIRAEYDMLMLTLRDSYPVLIVDRFAPHHVEVF